MSGDVDSLEDLQSISKGAVLFSGGKILSKVLGFLISLLLTRGLGASLYGIYAYGNTLLSILLIFGRLGTGQAILRLLPKYEENTAKQNAVLGIAYATIIVASFLISILIFSFAPLVTELTLGNPRLTGVLRVFAILIPLNAIVDVTVNVFRSLERVESQVFINNVLDPATRVIFIGAGLLVGYSLVGIVAAITVGGTLVAVIAVYMMLSSIEQRPKFEGTQGQVHEFFDLSLPLTLKDVGRSLYNHIDIIMVGIFLAESGVAIYNVSIQVSSLLLLPLGAFGQLFPPIASRLYTNDEAGELEATYTTLTRWTVSITIVPTLWILLYPSEILAIFGDQFAAGGSILVLFALARFASNAVGPADYVLMMTDNQYFNLGNQWLVGVLNIALNYHFITRFGLIGAALATASVIVGVNLLRVVEIYYLEDLNPYSITYWKPVIAGVGAGVAMAVCKALLDGYVLLIVGGGTGGVVFIALLVIFGLEPTDRSVLKTMEHRLSNRL